MGLCELLKIDVVSMSVDLFNLDLWLTRSTTHGHYIYFQIVDNTVLPPILCMVHARCMMDIMVFLCNGMHHKCVVVTIPSSQSMNSTHGL